MWFDKSSDDIQAKIEKAASRYKEKFGTVPTLAFVNPGEFTTAKVKDIRVQAKPTIMPNHIWLGQAS